MSAPLIALTPGEPAGVGPELAVRLVAENHPERLVIIGSRSLLESTAEDLGLSIALPGYRRDSDDRHQLLDIPLATTAKAGQLDTRNAEYVLKTLEAAVDGCVRGEFAGLVTGLS